MKRRRPTNALRDQTYKRQVYKFLSVGIRALRNGETIPTYTWVSECPSCGASFRYTSSRKRLVYPNRRCERCRAPGRPVTPRLPTQQPSAHLPARRRSTPAVVAGARPMKSGHQICAAAARTLARGRRFSEWRPLQSLMWRASADDWRVLRDPAGRSESLRRELGGRSEIPTPHGTLQVEERSKGHWYFRLPPFADWTEEMAARYPWLG